MTAKNMLLPYLFLAVSPTFIIGDGPQKKTVREPIVPDDAPVVILFCHGLGGSSDDVNYYKKHAQLPFSFEAIDFPCSTTKCKNPYATTCLAQEKEQQALVDYYIMLVNQGYKVILWGLSNGASVIITTLGCYDLTNVAAVIVESPYADPKPWLRQRDNTLAPHYDFNGICPLDVVSAIDQTVPVLFVHSKKDSVVSNKETKKLHTSLKQAGHTKAEELSLSRGEHANFFDSPQGEVYRHGVHTFLKKHEIL